MAVFLVQRHRHVLRAGVARHVRQGFLHQPETSGLNDRIEAALQRVGHELNLQPGRRRLPLGVPAQRRRQAQIVEEGRAQFQRQAAHLFEHLPEHGQGVVQPSVQGFCGRQTDDRLQI